MLPARQVLSSSHLQKKLAHTHFAIHSGSATPDLAAPVNMQNSTAIAFAVLAAIKYGKPHTL
jgi:hypothetical protein